MKHTIVRSKMKKGLPLMNDPFLKFYVPATDWLKPFSFRRMMESYSSVFIKPDIGRMGNGIIRVRNADAEQVEISSQKGTVLCPIDQAYATISEMLNPDKKYIVQQGIDLATYRGRPFDVRIVLQKPSGSWRATLMCAKVAPDKSSVVTNVAKGAKDYNLYQLLDKADQALNTSEIIRDLMDISHQIAQILNLSFPLRIIGLDLAVDKKGKVWFLEANTKPDNVGLESIDRKLYRKYLAAKKMLRNSKSVPEWGELIKSKWDPSRWEIHEMYAGHSDLSKLLPPTAVLSHDSLSEFVNRYSSVYIKGRNGHTGSGIIKAWKTEEGYEFVKVKGAPDFTGTLEHLYDQVRDGRRASSVLVQRAIDLAEIEGRPFSIRLMFMRDGQENWQYAGMLAKVAGEDSVVTNVRRGGGYVTTIEHALSESLGYNHDQIESMKVKLIDTGSRFVHFASRQGYRTYESGIDLGIDKNGLIWMIEANLAYPSYGLFNRLTDKTFYNRIKELAAEYKLSRRERLRD